MEAVELLTALLCVAAYMTLAGCFMLAIETRRFNIRVLLIATTATAILSGLLCWLVRDSN